MAVQFLSEEWASAYSDALASHDGFQGAISGANLGLQFNVSDAASGPVGYYISIANGTANVALGETGRCRCHDLLGLRNCRRDLTRLD